MAMATTEQRLGRVHDDDERQDGGDRGVVARDAASRRVSRLAVEGGADADGSKGAGRAQGVLKGRLQDDAVAARRRRSFGGARALPPPHAWLAIEDAGGKKRYDSDPEAAAEEQWARLLGATGARQQQLRRSSFTVVRRERAAREAWLDRAWEMKRSWHQRNGGAPDADTPVVVVVGKGGGGGGEGGSGASSPGRSQQAGAVGGGGVAMDVEEVRACRDLGLELPSDCTVEIQCYGLTSGGSSPTHTASSGADSPGAVSSPGADPMDVKARLKVWAQAVALASTSHLGS
ncbi:hypothetical protein SEVIR_3G056800v4 [Setaria viridis]|uniref:Uncharacterized protein n=2 Tax=Setaria TaxID=4554 RepID=A0A368QBR2_SETIT|nr:uncharacterized protein LOC101774563 [Setaria italica]XP_034584608.1 uncharacterized protein LOC117847503 [Setaria viridis]RCV15436.1 hypothetical protein SETIT_3G056000v2 [Setaria italica]TKW24534.1 hypothetical protein SEVIR_3G056800v2 [Setaria viridis]